MVGGHVSLHLLVLTDIRALIIVNIGDIGTRRHSDNLAVFVEFMSIILTPVHRIFSTS